MSSPLLVCCGLATLDVVQRVARLPLPDEKVVAQGLDVTFGGPAANAAATAAALGVPSVVVTALGSGPVAALVRDGLERAGVRVLDLAAGAPGDPAVSSALLTAGTGQRAVVSTNATLRADDLGPAATAAAPGVLGGATALLVDGHHLAAGVVLAAEAAARGIVVLADGGSWKPSLERLLALVDVAVLSADFAVPAGLVAGSAGGAGAALGAPGAGGDAPDVLDAVAVLGPAVVARSDGPRPVRMRLGPGVYDEVAPPPVPASQVVDTLGAGDVLHGAVGAALARGEDPLAALRAGVAVAAESVQHAGALGWARARA